MRRYRRRPSSAPEVPAGNMTSPKPKALFLGSTYAGHRTRFDTLETNVSADGRVVPIFRRVTGWREGGHVEAVSLLSTGVRGRLRALYEARSFAAFPRPDVIWLSANEVVSPWGWAQLGPLRRPVLFDLDATPAQLDQMARWYFSRSAKHGLRKAIARLSWDVLRGVVGEFNAWSAWAADGLRSEGVAPERISVIPPGVDLTAWVPRPAIAPPDHSALRLLFVGGDFRRKGGDILLDVMRSPLGDSLELDIVTREAVADEHNVRVHRAEPNSARLRELYSGADVFVLPSRAECFGLAAVEAMASGLPVIMADVGGARDIVTPGLTGWLIQPKPAELARVLAICVSSRTRLTALGNAAREVAEVRFDARKNDARLLDRLLALIDGAPTGPCTMPRDTVSVAACGARHGRP